jgi:hypothetical protein
VSNQQSESEISPPDVPIETTFRAILKRLVALTATVEKVVHNSYENNPNSRRVPALQHFAQASGGGRTPLCTTISILSVSISASLL